ncbi:hypothetical protein [Candidatus Nitrosocosmicus franklandus]|uniref:Uncharacterized protein n=1 Tax=Candidatus Nitrosocosmicus franklandianus TaxID=1798806 RepID=A0A484I5A2_9ARCH|nr:hypothetical protein [Candidatus Nitrosocosmicus franklandus]VFJ12858.1 protein of unknown function [Candidatus Nitrosocosmicus franklandus]
MSSKKIEKKTDENRDNKSKALSEINKLETSIKSMSTNLNKLKSLFKKKGKA